MDERRSTPRWHTHRWNRAGLYRLAAAATIGLPRAWRLRLAAGLGRLSPIAFPAESRVVRANLGRIVAGASTARLDALTRDVFRHFALCFADLLAANRSARERARLLASVAGEAHLDDALAERSGVVVMTAHLGNWELGGRRLASRSARPTTVVVAAEPDPRLERFLREEPGPVRFVTRTDPTLAVGLVSALRRGEVVAVQGDRALGDRTDVPAPFFGAAARFPIGPFVLARAAGAPIVPAFCVLGDDRRYTVTVGEPIRVKADGEVLALTRWVAALEGMVRRHPEQWFNFFDVWNGSPAR